MLTIAGIRRGSKSARGARTSQRNPQHLLEQDLAVRHAAVVAEALAVIRDDDHDRAFVELHLLEGVEQALDLAVGVGDLAVVEPAQPGLPLGIVDLPHPVQVLLPQPVLERRARLDGGHLTADAVEPVPRDQLASLAVDVPLPGSSSGSSRPSGRARPLRRSPAA